MTPPIQPGIHPTVRRFIEDAGVLTQSLGLGRVAGQVYACLYFSGQPRTLAYLQQTLGISKGAVSMGVRQLEQWNAVRRTWVRGDRKDYYEANDWLGRIAKNAVLDVMGRRLAAMEVALKSEVVSTDDAAADVFVRERIEHMRRFYERAGRVWSNPLVRRLLG